MAIYESSVDIFLPDDYGRCGRLSLGKLCGLILRKMDIINDALYPVLIFAFAFYFSVTDLVQETDSWPFILKVLLSETHAFRIKAWSEISLTDYPGSLRLSCSLHWDCW